MADALKIALILTAVDKASSVFDKAGKKMNASLKGLDKSKSFFNKYGNYATVAGGIAVAALIPAIQAAEENQVAVKKLEQVYKSMGQNVAEASKHSQAYASKLQMQIGVEDEAIMAVQTKIATFKKVSDETARMNGHFDRATALAFDMASTGFGEASTNAVQLGKALQDPVKGINALSRSGITFTATEKKRIAALVASNKISQAQGIILKAIEAQVGGVSAASATASDKARVAWSEVTESIGKALLPTFTKIIDKVNEIIPRIQEWIEKNGTLITWIAGISAAVLGLGVAMKVIAFGIGGIQAAGAALGAVSSFLMANPIVLVIAAIAAAAYIIYKNWGGISDFFQRLWAGIKSVFLTVWKWIKKIFWDNQPAVLIYNNWGKIVSWFEGLWNKVKEKFWQFIDFLKALPSMLLQLGKNFIYSIWEGMKSVWNDLMSWFGRVWDDIKRPFEWMFGKGGAANVQNKQAEAVFNANNKFSNTVAPAMAPATPSYNSTSKSSTAFQFTPTYNLSGTATQADADMINANNQKGFNKLMKSYQNQQQRTGYN